MVEPVSSDSAPFAAHDDRADALSDAPHAAEAQRTIAARIAAAVWRRPGPRKRALRWQWSLRAMLAGMAVAAVVFSIVFHAVPWVRWRIGGSHTIGRWRLADGEVLTVTCSGSEYLDANYTAVRWYDGESVWVRWFLSIPENARFRADIDCLIDESQTAFVILYNGEIVGVWDTISREEWTAVWGGSDAMTERYWAIVRRVAPGRDLKLYREPEAGW